MNVKIWAIAHSQTCVHVKKDGLVTIVLLHYARKSALMEEHALHLTYVHVKNGGVYGVMPEKVVVGLCTAKKMATLNSLGGQDMIVRLQYVYRQSSSF